MGCRFILEESDILGELDKLRDLEGLRSFGTGSGSAELALPTALGAGMECRLPVL